MHRTHFLCAIAMTLTTGATLQAAPFLDTLASADFFDIFDDDAHLQQFGPLVATATANYEPALGVIQGVASAHAYADFGILRAQSIVSDTTPDDDGLYGTAYAFAAFNDQLTITNTFNPGATGQAQVTFNIRITGELFEDPAYPGSAFEPAAYADASLTIEAAGASPQVTAYEVLDPLLSPIVISEIVSATFTIDLGVPFDLFVSLDAFVEVSGVSSFANSAVLESITLAQAGAPLDFEITSASGTSYPVPAPAGTALCILASATAARRRR